MKADRLLSALLLLQAHKRMTGRELARRLEVSARTVHRDMESLSAAGVPIYAERGARGGWCLEEGWQTKVPGLDEAEMRALLMAQPPRLLGDLRLAGAAERALGKLVASLPAAMREQAVSMRQRLHVDAEGWRGTTEDLSMLPIVQDALWRDRQLTIRYSRPHAEAAERIVDPLGLVVKGSTWYLVAGTAEGFRTFRVSRIEAATILEAVVARPADFDLASHWKAATAQYQESFTRYQAVVRLDPPAAAWVKRWRTAWLAEPDGTTDPEGHVTVRMQFDAEEEARFVVLGLGSHVEVLAPDSLRDRVHAEAEAILGRAQPPARPPSP